MRRRPNGRARSPILSLEELAEQTGRTKQELTAGILGGEALPPRRGATAGDLSPEAERTRRQNSLLRFLLGVAVTLVAWAVQEARSLDQRLAKAERDVADAKEEAREERAALEEATWRGERGHLLGEMERARERLETTKEEAAQQSRRLDERLRDARRDLAQREKENRDLLAQMADLRVALERERTPEGREGGAPEREPWLASWLASGFGASAFPSERCSGCEGTGFQPGVCKEGQRPCGVCGGTSSLLDRNQ